MSARPRPIARGRRARSIVATILVAGVSAVLAGPGTEVRWRSGARSAPAPMQPQELGDAIAGLAARPDRSRVVVYLDAPPSAARRGEIESRGIRLLDSLGGSAYFATLRRGLDAPAAARTAGLVAIEAISTASKLHPDLAAGIARPWAIVRSAPDAAGRGPAADSGSAEVTVAVYALFHRDVDIASVAAETVLRHGGTVRTYLRSIHGIVAHLPAARIAAFAEEDAVMWVEPPLPPLSAINDGNRARVGADILQAAPYGLDGAGVTVLVYDAGQVFAHGDLAGRLTVGAGDVSGISDHATHVAGTVGGDGSGSGGVHRGMAPAVQIVSYGFEQEGGLEQGFLYTDPGDLEADYAAAIALHGADLVNNSIGTNTAPNGYPCEWEGDYGVTDAVIDAIVRGSLGAPLRVVWAAGNERQGVARCGATYHTVAPPANAKNHLTVGALNSDDDSVTSFTSWGPSDDGRLKPDVSAPGCQNGGDGGVTSTSSSGGYTVKCGTSMACPTVAGVAALLLQRYRAEFPGEPDFRNATLRAILAHTAQDVANPGPDYRSGYGSVRAVPAVDLVTQRRFVEGEVEQGQTYTFLVVVGEAEPELRVTAAWDDAPAVPNVDPSLVNDLDLRVIDPDGLVHHPWTLDPADPASPAMRNQRDGSNNIEQVVVDAPAPGTYVVEIEGVNVAVGPTQTFGAAASPSLIDCAPAGVLTTARSRISCAAVLDLRVVDCDLDTDGAVAETTTVAAVSGSDPAGETVLLTESAPASAEFLGSVSLATTDSAGVLRVGDGDAIVVTYIDADDGAGGTNVPVTRTVAVDCTAPGITGVTVTEVDPHDATVAVTIAEPARVTVFYGTVCGAPEHTAAAAGFATAQQVRLTGLSDEATYFFTVGAEDEAGNVSSDDNAGGCYTFTTPDVPDFWSEAFSTGLDLEGLSLTFTPNGSIDFYGACVVPLSGMLPTDPGGGIDLSLGDDAPASFTLSGGPSVKLYGQSHATLWIGPNGYVTLGAGDNEWEETFGAHFSRPRVAALFDDLDPGAGGTVSLKQLGDRVAVTWEDVPERGTTNANTFQVEMFFDGRIRMSWLAVDAADAIVGLSQGLGLDPDFLPSDLSAGAVCPPRPPFSQDVSLVTAVSTSVTVTLLGNDDSLPAPPSLTHRIVALPIVGTLTDPVAGQVIDVVPCDLAGGGKVVTYAPPFNYRGLDAFVYLADDGGAPPQGGDSSPATVAVTVGNLETLHEFLVDDANPGWSTTGAWAFGHPTGGGSHDRDPTSGATGSNVYGYNLSGDYANGMSPEFLTSAPLDLSVTADARLQFRRRLGIEEAFYDHASVQVSTDGSAWTSIWNHTATIPISETAWSLQSIDLSPIADGRPAVLLRWVMGPTDGAVTYPGWNIDDVRITGIDTSVTTSCTFAPGEVPRLKFSDDPDSLVWLPAVYVGGTTRYDVIRSNQPDDFRRTQAGATCVESDDAADTTAVDTAVPAAGGTYFYLVRAENECGAGPLSPTQTGRSCSAP